MSSDRKLKVLILHDPDKKNSRGALLEILESLAAETKELESLEAAEHADFACDVILIDEGSRAGSLLPTLKKLKESETLSSLPVIALTANSSAAEVIETMRLGALDHLLKPIDKSQLTAALKRAQSKPRNEQSSVVESFVGHSAAMQEVHKLAGLSAASATNVLISGETGTGKSALAREIFAHTTKPRGTLSVIECTAVPEDYESFVSISEQSAGTVILDEIGDLNLSTQGLLVRALKTLEAANQKVCRIIATTQYDLISMVQEKRFREDLYYRLNVLPIHLPPLKDRGADILLLAEYFLQEASFSKPKSLSSGAAKILLDTSWPGNVRQLRNLMHHLNVTVRSALIEADDLQIVSKDASKSSAGEIDSDSSLDYHKVLGAVEKELLERALAQANGSRSEAARLLGINRQLLYSKLKAHGLGN